MAGFFPSSKLKESFLSQLESSLGLLEILLIDVSDESSGSPGEPLRSAAAHSSILLTESSGSPDPLIASD